MTKVARIVLQDAKHAITVHNRRMQSEEFRASWLAIIGLLRAVGHVLSKVDKNSSYSMLYAIDQKWQSLRDFKPEPAILWQFIEYERNRFLKNYEHGIRRTLTVESLVPEMYITVDGANSRGGMFAPGHEYESVIADGPFSGRYERDVAWEAHNWWKSCLNEIDEIAASKA